MRRKAKNHNNNMQSKPFGRPGYEDKLRPTDQEVLSSVEPSLIDGAPSSTQTQGGSTY